MTDRLGEHYLHARYPGFLIAPEGAEATIPDPLAAAPAEARQPDKEVNQ